jgi:hypothetical protein
MSERKEKPVSYIFFFITVYLMPEPRLQTQEENLHN